MVESTQGLKFMEFASKHYDVYKKKWEKYLFDKGIEFDEDVYNDTIIKVYEYINANGIKDDTDNGLASYWFKSFNMNIKREQQYSRNAMRDKNVDATEELDKEVNGDEDRENKIRRDVFYDWSTIYLLQLVEREFDNITFHCFRLYYILPKMTYEKLRALTKITDAKKRVITVKKWLKENITKQQLEVLFAKYYDSD